MEITKRTQNKRYEVLLVEDDKIDQRAFKRLVEEKMLPYDCTIAEGVMDARSILNRRKFDIVILDYFLADGVAFDLLDLTKDTPVIIVTASGDEEIAVNAMKAGSCDYLVKDPNGNYLNVIPATIKKVIDQKKAEARVKEYNRLKNELVANISHELRTPLTIFKNVISNALAGSMGTISQSLRENLEMANEAAERLGGIISSFVDISEIEAGNLKLLITRFDLKSIITKAINNLTALAAEKNVKIKFHSSVNEFFINADRERILQVLTELIGNAIKFMMQNGRIDISAREINNEACIEIQDNGTGIDSSEINRIFDRFVQTKQMIGAGRHGTGLGLSIAKELVEMHGGRIEVQSRPGDGTTVTVFLPLNPKPVPESLAMTV